MPQSSSSATLVPAHTNANFVLGTSNGKLIFNCHLDKQGNIICPNDAQVVETNGTNSQITGISSNKDYFYVNDYGTQMRKAAFIECKRTGSVATGCTQKAETKGQGTENAHLIYNNYMYLTSDNFPYLTYCKLDDQGSITRTCDKKITFTGGATTTSLYGITTNKNNDIFLAGRTKDIYKCQQNSNDGSLTCSKNITTQFITGQGLAFHSLKNGTELLYEAAWYAGANVYSVNNGNISARLQTVARNYFNQKKISSVFIHKNNIYFTQVDEIKPVLFRCDLDSQNGLILSNRCTPNGDLQGEYSIQGKKYSPTTILFY